MLKKKLLLPILLLLKLKLKALMPILVAIIGIKSLKALILSKLAIVLVVGFIAYQFLAKSGWYFYEFISFSSLIYFRNANAYVDGSS